MLPFIKFKPRHFLRAFHLLANFRLHSSSSPWSNSSTSSFYSSSSSPSASSSSSSIFAPDYIPLFFLLSFFKATDSRLEKRLCQFVGVGPWAGPNALAEYCKNMRFQLWPRTPTLMILKPKPCYLVVFIASPLHTVLWKTMHGQIGAWVFFNCASCF